MWLFNNILSSIWIDGQSMTSKKLAKYKNMSEFMNVYATLVNEALTRYKFSGLPDTVNERVVLESLLWYGSVGFFIKSENVLALPGLPTKSYTLYGDPTAMIVYGRNGFNEEIPLYIPNGEDSTVVRESTSGIASKEGTGVWVRENRMVYPFINYCIEYADKIADTLRTLDTTRMNIKRPYVIVAEESIVNSIKSFFNKRDANEEYIISSGVFPADKINMLPFETTAENIRDCTGLVEWYLAQFRQLEGINQPGTVDKKAQISVPELNQNEDVSEEKKNAVVEYLQQQLDFVNEKLGTSISVEETEPEEEQPTEEEDKEESEDGTTSDSNEDV